MFSYLLSAFFRRVFDDLSMLFRRRRLFFDMFSTASTLFRCCFDLFLTVSTFFHAFRRFSSFAASSPSSRKASVSSYCLKVVLPALRWYGQGAFHRCGSALSSWPYHLFQQAFVPVSHALLQADWNAQEWHMLRVWSLVRCTGRWPVPLFGFNICPLVLSSCPFVQLLPSSS